MPRPSSSLSAVMLALDRAKDLTRQAKRQERAHLKRIEQLEAQIRSLQSPQRTGSEKEQ
jgi:hypothetical protein